MKAFPTHDEDRLIRPAEAATILGYQCRSSVYRLVREGRLPPPVRISRRCVGWRSSTLARFLELCERRGPAAKVA